MKFKRVGIAGDPAPTIAVFRQQKWAPLCPMPAYGRIELTEIEETLASDMVALPAAGSSLRESWRDGIRELTHIISGHLTSGQTEAM